MPWQYRCIPDVHEALLRAGRTKHLAHGHTPDGNHLMAREILAKVNPVELVLSSTWLTPSLISPCQQCSRACVCTLLWLRLRSWGSSLPGIWESPSFYHERNHHTSEIAACPGNICLGSTQQLAPEHAGHSFPSSL